MIIDPRRRPVSQNLDTPCFNKLFSPFGRLKKGHQTKCLPSLSALRQKKGFGSKAHRSLYHSPSKKATQLSPSKRFGSFSAQIVRLTTLPSSHTNPERSYGDIDLLMYYLQAVKMLLFHAK